MAKFDTAIDINEVDRSAAGGGSFELMPFGDYVLELSAISVETIDGGTAHKYTYEIIEPEQFAKRRIWDTMMLSHPSNQKWVHASVARVAKLADAVGFVAEKEGELDPRDGKYKLTDDDALLFRAFLAKVVQREGKPKGDGTKYNDQNEVADFYNPQSPDCPNGPSIYDVQPRMLPPIGKKAATPAPTPANQNQRPAANQNAQAAKPAGRRPWAKAS